MGFDFRKFGDDELSEAFVEWLVDEQWVDIGIHFGRFWDYYHNSRCESGNAGVVDGKVSEASRNYIQAQEYGLPPRITGVVYSGSGGLGSGTSVKDIQRKEVVIENDIAWRVNAMVDFLFGKGVSFVSKAPEVGKRREIEKVIKAVFDANGGVGFFQDMAVLGSVYGFVDCVIRPGEEVVLQINRTNGTGSDSSHVSGASNHFSSFDSILQLASCIGLELIEAPRALPVLDENDYRKINYYVQNFYQQKNAVSEEGGFLSRLLGGRSEGTNRQSVMVTEIVGPEVWQRYEIRNLLVKVLMC